MDDESAVAASPKPVTTTLTRCRLVLKGHHFANPNVGGTLERLCSVAKPQLLRL
jgi:hypothetical protein